MKRRETVGFSRKVASTVLAACGAQAIVFAVNLIATGDFDRVEAAQLAGIALTAVLGSAAGWLSYPDDTRLVDRPEGERSSWSRKTRKPRKRRQS